MAKSTRPPDGQQLGLFDDPQPIAPRPEDRAARPIGEMTLEELRALQAPYLERRYEEQRRAGLRRLARRAEQMRDLTPDPVAADRL